MLKYIISSDEYGPFINIKEKQINGYKGYIGLNDEINPLSQGGLGYLKQIVKELKEVVEGKRDDCVFGFETTLIFCYKKGYTFKDIYTNEIVSYLNGKVIIDYDYGDETLETDIKPEEIYKMMKEWKEYIEKWEKETGKKFGR